MLHVVMPYTIGHNFELKLEKTAVFSLTELCFPRHDTIFVPDVTVPLSSSLLRC